MDLNLLFTTKNIVLIFIGIFYLLIFSHNILGNIFEGYDSLSTDPITAKDSPSTVQNKLDLQNAASQDAGSQNNSPPPTDGSSQSTPQVMIPSSDVLPSGGSSPDGSSPPTDGSQPVQGFQNWN